MDRPEWWTWELIFTAHAEARMEERGVSEVEVRALLEDALQIRAAKPGRWLVTARYRGRNWAVVLEPEPVERLVFVVTTYESGVDG